MITWFVRLLASSAFVIGITSFGQPVEAEDLRRAMSMVPSKTILELQPGQSWSGDLQVGLDAGVGSVLYLQPSDWRSAGEEGGTPYFYFEQESEPSTSLKRWMQLDRSELKVSGAAYEKVRVTIEIPVNASPGGHYGAIMATATPASPDQNFVGSDISSIMASLYIVNVTGDVKEDLSILDFAGTDDVFNGTPAAFSLRFANMGNTHVAPSGVVEITNEFGTKVGEMVIDTGALVLPNDIRKFSLHWGTELVLKLGKYEIPVGDPFAFGFYQAKATIWYGDGQNVLSASERFFVVPWMLIGLIIAILAILVLIFEYLFHRYKLEVVVRKMMQRLNQEEKKSK